MFRFALWFLLGSVTGLGAREFTVLVYNVENLFDVDGVAEYEDYQVPPFNTANPYTPRRLLTKLENIATVLATINDGAGPEVILFQEFELDRTPFDDGRSDAEVLAAFAEWSVEELLTTRFSPAVANLSAIQWLLKLLAERGLEGYTAVTIDPAQTRNHTAHCNVIFTRFPVTRSWQEDMAEARDLQVVELEVDGHPFFLLNNHWRSGASSASSVPTRRQNAQVVRAQLDALLLADPAADVLIAGDLNSYYNQAVVFPDRRPVGVNDILGSETNEAGLVAGEGPILYNLWGELPLAERGSEVYQGYWGTLMQMLITRGLYDRRGIQYVDGSFFRLALEGVNIDSQWGRPIAWASLGDGSGFSDHLPIGARFRTTGEGNTRAFLNLEAPTAELEEPGYREPVEYTALPAGRFPSATVLNALSDAERVPALGRLFEVRGTIPADGARAVEIDGMRYGLYLPTRDVYGVFGPFEPGRRVHFVGEFGVHRGEMQFVVQHPSWIR